METSLFSPEGLLLNNEDANRKFASSFVLASIKGGEPTPICIEFLEFPRVRFFKENFGSSISCPFSDINLIKLCPNSGFYNYQSGVIKVVRTGNRQWQMGLHPSAIHISLVSDGSNEPLDINFKLAKSIFLPYWLPLKAALFKIKEDRKGIAINPYFWLKAHFKPVGKIQYVTLYRKDLSLGIFIEGDFNRFYLQEGAEVFANEVKKLMER